MKDVTTLYQQGLENLMKSTAAVPTHLQGAEGALAWWQDDSSLMAKAQMPWDKKDEEEAEDEDEQHDKGTKAKQGEDTDESDEDEDDSDEEEMEKSLGDEMVSLRQKNRDSMKTSMDSFTEGKPRYVRRSQKKHETEIMRDAMKDKKTWTAREREGLRGGYEGARDYDVQKSFDELYAATEKLLAKGGNPENKAKKNNWVEGKAKGVPLGNGIDLSERNAVEMATGQDGMSMSSYVEHQGRQLNEGRKESKRGRGGSLVADPLQRRKNFRDVYPENDTKRQLSAMRFEAMLNLDDGSGVRRRIHGVSPLPPDVNKSLDELSAITAQLEGKTEAEASPLLKSIDALNRLAGA